MPMPAVLALIHRTFRHLNDTHASLPSGLVTRLAGEPAIRDAAARLDAAALTGDVAGTRTACRQFIQAWKTLAQEGR